MARFVIQPDVDGKYLIYDVEKGEYLYAGMTQDRAVSQAAELERQLNSPYYDQSTTVKPVPINTDRTVTPAQAAADNAASPVTITDSTQPTQDPVQLARNLSSNNAEYNQLTQQEKIDTIANTTGLSPNDPAVINAVNAANGSDPVDPAVAGQTVAVTGNGNGTASGVNSDSVVGQATDPSQQGSVISNYDSTNSRLESAGLMTGARMAAADIAGQVFNLNFNRAPGTPLAPEQDWRVRISMAPTTAGLFYNNNNNDILKPLAETSGLIFPYTPQISITHNAKYQTQSLTHSNYASYFYESSEVQSISIQAEFTIQSQKEGRYLMAAVHFLRSITKMFFGQSALAGTPPPMVFLDGYGAPYLPHVPCVATNFQHTMPSNVDYIEVLVGPTYGGILTRLPTLSTLSIGLQPIYSRRNIARNFTLENFSSGALIRNSTDSSGGFL